MAAARSHTHGARLIKSSHYAWINDRDYPQMSAGQGKGRQGRDGGRGEEKGMRSKERRLRTGRRIGSGVKGIEQG